MAIKKEISSHDWQEIKLANLKAHITGPIDSSNIVGANGDTSAWTSFGDSTNPFVKVEAESYGDVFKLASDKSSFIVTVPCIFEFSGCVHIQNQSGASGNDVDIGLRIYKNGNSEARCSQVWYSVTLKDDDGEETLRYTGTDVTHKPNEYFNLQYYFDDDGSSDVNFDSSATFDNQVAATLYVKAIGLPQFTDRNEKIVWHITNP
jgi:hypothetical protein